MLRLSSLAVGIALLLSGCSIQDMADKAVPATEQAIARALIEHACTGDWESAQGLFEPAYQSEAGKRGIDQISTVMNGGSIRSIELIGFFRHISTESGRTTRLNYQLELSTGWFTADFVIVSGLEKPLIRMARFNPLAGSLQSINAFTFTDKTSTHFGFLAGFVLIPVVMLTSLILCLRSRVKRKWLWTLFILVGVVAYRLNWSNGEVSIQPLSLQFGGIGFARIGIAGPWLLSLSFPLGALCFLFRWNQVRRDRPPQLPPGA